MDLFWNLIGTALERFGEPHVFYMYMCIHPSLFVFSSFSFSSSFLFTCTYMFKNTTECPAGRYSSETGLQNFKMCTICPKGTYSAVEGNKILTNCVKCLAGKYSTEKGCNAQVPSSVTYPDGSVHTCSEACVSCGKGKYSGTSGATTLKPKLYRVIANFVLRDGMV